MVIGILGLIATIVFGVPAPCCPMGNQLVKNDGLHSCQEMLTIIVNRHIGYEQIRI